MAVDFNKLIDEEVEKKVATVKRENTTLKGKVAKLSAERDDALALVEKLKENADIFEAGKKIKGLIKPETIESLFTFKETYRAEQKNGGYDEAPNWFYLIFQYWNNRTDVINIHRFLGIDIPDWAYDIKLPSEWNKEECLRFIATVKRHSSCNGNYTERNFGWWYREHRYERGGSSAFSDPIKMCGSLDGSSNSTYIPWQWILRNPLFTQDSDVFSAMIAVVEKKIDNSHHFLKLEKYGHKFTPEQRKAFVYACFTILQKERYHTDLYRDFVSASIGMIDLSGNDKKLIEYYVANCSSKPTAMSSATLHRFYLINFVKELKDKIIYIEDCPRFSKTEKAELIKGVVLDKYSDEALVKELLQEEA